MKIFRACFLVYIVYIALFSQMLMGQQKNMRFKHISFQQGLIQSPVSVISQDSKGFIWIGNWKGLFRYDGTGFKWFRYKDGNSVGISNNRVNSICQIDSGDLLVGTSNGLNWFDSETETFKYIDIKRVKGGRNFISSVIRDHTNKVWISTFAGVKFVDLKRSRTEDLNSFKTAYARSLFDGVTLSLFEDSQHSIWVGTTAGVRRFDPATRQILSLPLPLMRDKDFKQAKIITIREDRRRNMWFGTEKDGVYQFDVKTGKLTHFVQGEKRTDLASNWIKDILIKDDRTVWMGTRGGLSVFSYDTNNFSSYVHNPFDNISLSNNNIWSLFQDNTSNVWIGTFSGGLNLYYPGISNFSSLGETVNQKVMLYHPEVNAILQDANDNFWVGTSGGGVTHLSKDFNIIKSYSLKSYIGPKSSDVVKSLSFDGNGDLWIGSLDGLFKLNRIRGQFSSFQLKDWTGRISERLINTLAAESNGVWAGSNGAGLYFINNDGTSRIYYRDEKTKTSLSDNFVTSLLKEGNEGLWVGTQNGLNYFDKVKGVFTRCYKRSDAYGISNNSVLTLFKDSKKRLWVGTEGGGLNYFDHSSGRFYAITERLGLREDVVQDVLEDNGGNIWISTDNGLFKIIFKNFRVPFRAEDIHIISYTANDGLSGNQFLTNSGLKTSSGQLLFGGINGLQYFFPSKILKNSFPPKIVLTDLLINNKRLEISEGKYGLQKSITQTSSITLKYNQNNLILSFAALNFVNPENNQYAYQLEGYNKSDDWQYSKTNLATYTNLAPGNYVFKVKASNNDEVWNDNPISLNIQILPPVWLTWWAYMLYALLASIILFVIIRFFRARAQLKRELYAEHLYNERQQELYQLKLDFFTNISHEIRTPLTLIIGPLEKLLNNYTDNNILFNQLSAVKKNADRLMKLVSELLDFRKVETGNLKLQIVECDIDQFLEEIFLSFKNLALIHHINYEFAPVNKAISLQLDKDQIEKVFFNLLSNAFKFTPDYGTIRLALNLRSENDNEWLDITISDTGKGIPEEYHEKLFENFFQVGYSDTSSGTGIGLALAQKIVQFHNGEIKVKSQVSTNEEPGLTEFTVSLPVKNDLLVKTQNESPATEYSSDYTHFEENTNEDPVILQKLQFDRKYTLLVVEDNIEVRQFLREALEAHYFIIECDNGAEGLDLAFEHIPDLIISDVMMPVMNGLDFCEKIKTDERTNHIPVILLTARAAFTNQEKGFDKGADAYITKPFSLRILELQVRNILASKEAFRKKFLPHLFLEDSVASDSPEEKFIKKLIGLIEERIEEPELEIKHIIREIGMSKTTLYRKLKALTGYSIAEFVKSVRLKRAAILLKQSGLNISEIAYSVGFNDRKYFSKEFKKQYGITPTEYGAANGQRIKDPLESPEGSN